MRTLDGADNAGDPRCSADLEDIFILDQFCGPFFDVMSTGSASVPEKISLFEDNRNGKPIFRTQLLRVNQRT